MKKILAVLVMMVLSVSAAWAIPGLSGEYEGTCEYQMPEWSDAQVDSPIQITIEPTDSNKLFLGTVIFEDCYYAMTGAVMAGKIQMAFVYGPGSPWFFTGTLRAWGIDGTFQNMDGYTGWLKVKKVK